MEAGPGESVLAANQLMLMSQNISAASSSDCEAEPCSKRQRLMSLATLAVNSRR